MRGGVPARIVSLGERRSEYAMHHAPQKPLREGSYRPIGGALRADVPQRLRRFAHASVAEWPRAVSGCVTPAAIVIHRPGTGCFVCCGP
jgi:hypothetical protein